MDRERASKIIARSANDTDLTDLVMLLLERAMTDVGDFDPEDEVAKRRSEMAKYHADKAYVAYRELRINEAMEEADIAMRYMEGDL